MSSSTKGSAFEREIAKQFSLWWTKNKQDDVFYRSHASGGRATRRTATGKKTQGQYGDICATDSRGEPLMRFLSIECKKGYKEWNVLDIVDRAVGVTDLPLQQFISQSERQSEEAGVPWFLLVFQRPRRKKMVCLPRSLFLTIEKKMGMLKAPSSYCVFGEKQDEDYKTYILLPLVDFLDWCSPSFFKKKKMRIIEQVKHTRASQ